MITNNISYQTTILYFIKSHTLLKAKLIVIFIFASSRLVERASRREHLSTSREVDVADAARTIDERLGMLEDAVRSLSDEFALFTLNNVLKNQAPTGQAQTNRATPIHTSELTRTVPKSWCYYHVRFGKDARKCSSDLCTFSPKISTENKTFKKLYTSDKPEKHIQGKREHIETYPFNIKNLRK
ncbi:hypothetical protein AGLY_017903 [Aphis glycines]|uniref:Uncharacterized protein n=1 Tax=Aphis glycines TaxID=307491 RepID=A0A6G0STH7_APHGL|nr:hypothetical protein AGLY_017903 [Aphis glycines]